ncbi:DUF2075 domain-containing protein [Alkalimonas sp. MEB108]|uniref:DUF2075 domain-containing protein n=1 Tax=Alkalimonas cellulosilytica TaxID=3058395 RepID=A0ABU7J643_9GAMM|nr:DUF2075 domain-containing protein [Alkalimonas sp. MEB108]MEE2001990.1 DUF2075 domain-containing protein [Alkalimonas sp. MEB108]
MMSRAYYTASIPEFLAADQASILGQITPLHGQDLLHSQTQAWIAQISLLKQTLSATSQQGQLFFEFMIPRMGRRADVVLVLNGIIFVLEFKVGANTYSYADRAQTAGYALDLKHFHEGSHHLPIVPILVCTKATEEFTSLTYSQEQVASVLCCNGINLATLLSSVSQQLAASPFDIAHWLAASYKPTPTIVEAAQALYAKHDVVDITRSEAGSENIGKTCHKLFEIIHRARLQQQKVICFVTGVPGAGKTLVGLNIANQHANPNDDEYSVFLSGNGPLVAVLQEALAQDLFQAERTRQLEPITQPITKKEARQRVESFIQNIHRFRDEYIKEQAKPPEHVAIFDEAQRAWDLEQTAKFMQQKRGLFDFNMSEPEFLISVMDRHQDWAVIIALIGGGQEINVGEAGIIGWFKAIEHGFSHWQVYCSPNLLAGEYVNDGIEQARLKHFQQESSLHLATSMRSFRAENLSSFVHYLIAGDANKAKQVYSTIASQYPIVLSRDLAQARDWLKQQTLANRRSGLLASSNAIRLKAEGIFVKNTIEPEKWFLAAPNDIRSSNFLEDTATEFDVQGLELDWALVAWDADLRFTDNGFQHWRFAGTKWQKRQQRVQQQYLENAYRVLLTRAREGMVIFVPEGNDTDSTRQTSFYDGTYAFLQACGLPTLKC